MTDFISHQQEDTLPLFDKFYETLTGFKADDLLTGKLNINGMPSVKLSSLLIGTNVIQAGVMTIFDNIENPEHRQYSHVYRKCINLRTLYRQIVGDLNLQMKNQIDSSYSLEVKFGKIAEKMADKLKQDPTYKAITMLLMMEIPMTLALVEDDQ